MEDVKTEMSEEDRLKIEIGELKMELKTAKTNRGAWTDPPTATYAHFDKEVTRISQQLSDTSQQLDRAQAKELLLLKANSVAAEQSSQAGTSLFVLFLSVAPHGIHVLYVFPSCSSCLLLLAPRVYCSNSVLGLVGAQCDVHLSVCCCWFW
jgi:hypothetical protein